MAKNKTEFDEWDKCMASSKKWKSLGNAKLIRLAEEGETDGEFVKELAKRLDENMYPLSTKDSIEYTAKIMERFVNNTICPTEEFVDHVLYKYHRTLQTNLMKLCLAVINGMSTLSENQTDARNKYAVKAAREIMDLIRQNDVCIDYPCV